MYELLRIAPKSEQFVHSQFGISRTSGEFLVNSNSLKSAGICPPRQRNTFEFVQFSSSCQFADEAIREFAKTSYANCRTLGSAILECALTWSWRIAKARSRLRAAGSVWGWRSNRRTQGGIASTQEQPKHATRHFAFCDGKRANTHVTLQILMAISKRKKIMVASNLKMKKNGWP